MTPAERAELRALLEAPMHTTACVDAIRANARCVCDAGQRQAALFLAARSAVPALLDRLDEMALERDELAARAYDDQGNWWDVRAEKAEAERDAALARVAAGERAIASVRAIRDAFERGDTSNMGGLGLEQLNALADYDGMVADAAADALAKATP